jgi:integrase
LLSLAAERFIEYKSHQVQLVTLNDLKVKIGWFVEILREYNGGRPPLVSELNAAKMRTFRDTLMKMPANRRNHPGVSIKALLKMNLTPITPRTAKFTATAVSQFLVWIETEGYPIQRDLKVVLTSIKTAAKKHEPDQRVDFSNEDLLCLFNSDDYAKGLFKRASEYWVPLLAVFTGARLAELVQLHCSDIYQHEGIWVFDINDDEDKQVKTKKSKRLVPIHSALIELGFLDFVKRRGKTDKRLFPEEARTEEGKFDAFTKCFGAPRKTSKL